MACQRNFEDLPLQTAGFLWFPWGYIPKNGELMGFNEISWDFMGFPGVSPC
jgi:hypothetical protein